jgi:hypothetical protein
MRKSTFALALLFVVVVWIGLQGNQPRAADNVKPPLQKWEYYILESNLNFKDADLNSKGDKGWEIVSIDLNPQTHNTAVFKRPKQ